MNITGAGNREEVSPAIAAESAPNQDAQADSKPATHGDIEKKAYEIYENNGCQAGTSEKDWYQAERELGKETVQESRATERMVNEGSPVPEVAPVRGE